MRTAWIGLFVGSGAKPLVPGEPATATNLYLGNTTLSSAAQHDNWVFQIKANSNWAFCLDIYGGTAFNGAFVGLWECNGKESQNWFFDSGSYSIQWGGDASFCIDAGNVDRGQYLFIWECNGLSHQQWGFDGDASTIFLSASQSDVQFCMDIPGNNVQWGQQLWTWDCTADPNYIEGQQFYLMSGITIRADSDFERCLDLSGGYAFNGAPVEMWDCNGLWNQQWVFEGLSGEIKWAGDMTYCLASATGTAGSPLWLWECGGWDNQQWTYDGTIYQVTGAGVLCLDIPGGDMSNSVSPALGECTHCWQQLWQVEGPKDGARQLLHGAGLSDCPPGGPTPPSPPKPPSPVPVPVPTPAPVPVPPPTPPMWPNLCKIKAGGDWPEFVDKAALQADDKWSKYFRSVYGKIPDGGDTYPLCVSGFFILYENYLKDAGISVKAKSNPKVGDYYQAGEYHHTKFHGGIWHDQNKGYEAFPSNVWVEVAHCEAPLETDGAWYLWFPGMGIWLNSGKTKAYDYREEHMKDIWGNDYKIKCNNNHRPYFSCGDTLFKKSLKERGWETVQYTKEGAGQHGHGAYNTFMFIHTPGLGKYTCGAQQTPWRMGWASDQCACDAHKECQNCNGKVGAVKVRLNQFGNLTVESSPCDLH